MNCQFEAVVECVIFHRSLVKGIISEETILNGILKGKCPTDGGGGNCPDCSGVTPSPVCDTSLVEFTSSCELVKELCSLSIVAFDDGMVFTGFSDADYFGYCQSYVGWKGPCAGL